MGIEELIIFYIASTFLIYFGIRSGIEAVLLLNISKVKYKKIINKQSLLSRILLSYVKDRVKKHKIFCKTMLLLNYFYLSISLIFLIIIIYLTFKSSILKLDITNQVKLVKSLVMVKSYTIDFALGLFFIFKTGHDKKNGGVKWKI